MPKYDVFFARFPFGAKDHPDTIRWLIETNNKAKADPRIGNIYHRAYDDTPITMTRNLAVEEAKSVGADILVMIDNDLNPDMYVGRDELAKPFWETSLEFLLNHTGPCVVAAPYCGKPPFENVFVFKWANAESEHPNTDRRVEQYTREESYQMMGIHQAAALPTGLIMYDMRAFNYIPKPYFYYEWTDDSQSKKASTEDVTNTRDLSLVGIKQYCNWDAWAGHWKSKCVGKPIPITVEAVRESYREALIRGASCMEKLIDFKAPVITPAENG